MINGLFFSKASTVRPEHPVVLPAPVQMEAARPEDYIAGEGLVDAVNTALLIGQPLLLTGHPGTGKTQLASALAYQLGYPAPLRFEAKSTSQARDLFYHYDAVGHFRAKDLPALQFIRYAALGKAVLLATEPEDVKRLLPPGMIHPARSASVVLIDEVDKAPRDFPNDILVELEELSFRIPELDGETLRAPQDLRPVVVITSNSERDLPDAFLRRCVYYDIPFPEDGALLKILERRLKSPNGAAPNASFIENALALFHKLRALPELRRKPATAELIAWVSALRRAFPEQANPLEDGRARVDKLGVLVKTKEDLALARRAVAANFGA